MGFAWDGATDFERLEETFYVVTPEDAPVLGRHDVDVKLAHPTDPIHLRRIGRKLPSMKQRHLLRGQLDGLCYDVQTLLISAGTQRRDPRTQGDDARGPHLRDACAERRC